MFLTAQWHPAGACASEPDDQFVFRSAAAAAERSWEVTTMAAAAVQLGRSRADADGAEVSESQTIADGELDVRYVGSPPAHPRQGEAWLEVAAEMQSALARSVGAEGSGDGAARSASGGVRQAAIAPPSIAEKARLRSMELRFPASPSAVGAIAEVDADVVVLSPSAQPTARLLKAAVGADVRLALLAGDPGRGNDGRPPVDVGLAAGLSVVLLGHDRSGLAAELGNRARVVGLPFWADTARSPLADELSDSGPYVVALADWPHWREPLWPGVLGRALLGGLDGLGVVFVGDTGAVLWRKGEPVVAYGRPDRSQLWDLVSGSVCLVDLREPGELDRELLEAMLLGVPAVGAPGISPACSPGASGGRIVFHSGAELIEAVTLLHRDEAARSEVVATGRAWAETVCVGPERFADAVVEALC